ncbi:MAG: DUF1646 domain-containing protein [Clostridia bacterium]|nr:MAG: DUF1646 domain-containing protein [Clostridia bacterium]
MIIGLAIILLLVLALPFLIKPIEENLEPFLFVMGVAAALVSGVMTTNLLLRALEEPIMITAAVLAAGIAFKLLEKYIRGAVDGALKVMPVSIFFIVVVVVLGLASSFITAIVASIVLVEIISAVRFDRKSEIALDVIACYAIGLGAVLTPVGEPLATIATSKLGVDFWYLFRTLAPYVVPGVVAMGLFAAFYLKPKRSEDTLDEDREKETYAGIVIRAAKVYLFVMALTFLGEGFKPVIDMYVIGLDARLLYWINMISAVLDNATLTAAEISNKMHPDQIKAVLMGLLISGGILIPGNIPNIISASKLKIKSSEWARLGAPIGFITLIIYFVILFVI